MVEIWKRGGDWIVWTGWQMEQMIGFFVWLHDSVELKEQWEWMEEEGCLQILRRLLH